MADVAALQSQIKIIQDQIAADQQQIATDNANLPPLQAELILATLANQIEALSTADKAALNSIITADGSTATVN